MRDKVNILDILADWAAGKSQREIAESYGVAEHQIQYIIRKHNKCGTHHASTAGPGRGPSEPRMPKWTCAEMIGQLVYDYDDVTIEAGLNGGYIVTAGGWTSGEQRTVEGALAAALHASFHGDIRRAS